MAATPMASRFRSILLRPWHGLNDWWKAALLAMVVIGCVQAFVLRWVTVRSNSMYATLRPGDVLAVARWPVWTGFQRGDVVVFRDPLQDDRPMWRRKLQVKRVAAMPGDRMRLRDGVLYVNDARVTEAPGVTHSWLVRLKRGTDTEAFLRSLGDPPAFLLPDRRAVEMPLNAALANELQRMAPVVEASPLRTASGAPGNIFPFSPTHPWNSDDYGPLRVPRKGDTLHVDASTLPLYDRLITHYEHGRLHPEGARVRIEGGRDGVWVVQQDYYFVLGDSRHYSADSRSWGFVPADHLVGRALFVVGSDRALQ
jgi:signal peptidase I